jgi:hypothetical protein
MAHGEMHPDADERGGERQAATVIARRPIIEFAFTA